MTDRRADGADAGRGLNGSVTLVDTNVLFDYLTEDSEWFDWSSAMPEEASNTGTVAINQVVYAEVSIRYSTVEQLDDDLSVDYFARLSIPWRPPSSPARPSPATSARAAHGARRCRTSSSARTRP